MGDGSALRRATAIAALGAALVAGAIPASAGETKTVRGEAHTVGGFVVPGEAEVIVVEGMPRNLLFQLPVSPGFRTPRCRGDWVCEPTIARSAGGGSNFKTSAEGSATITFVMPRIFHRRNLKTGKKEGPLRFREGEGVRIQANGFKGKVTGIAVAKARVGE